MKFTSLALLLVALPCLSSAAVTASGDFKTGTPTITFTTSISILITSSTPVEVQALVFDEWVVNDTTATTAPSSSLLSYSIDGGVTQTVPISDLTDNMTFPLGSITANDGYLHFNTRFTVNPGQTVTFAVQTLTFTGSPTFNQPPAVFTGNVYLVNNAAVAISAIPEPSISLLGAIGTLGLLRRRR